MQECLCMTFLLFYMTVTSRNKGTLHEFIPANASEKQNFM